MHPSHADPLPWWFPLAFVGAWLVISHLLAWIGGHISLLARYPPLAEPEESFFFASGQTGGGVRHRSSLYVGIGRTGLHLAPNFLFRPLFWFGVPCIPWSEIRCLERQTSGVAGWFRASAFEIPAATLRFHVRGAAGKAIERRLDGTRPNLVS